MSGSDGWTASPIYLNKLPSGRLASIDGRGTAPATEIGKNYELWIREPGVTEGNETSYKILIGAPIKINNDGRGGGIFEYSQSVFDKQAKYGADYDYEIAIRPMSGPYVVIGTGKTNVRF
ncbi:hypothetical protein ACIP5Y_26505 [Nocardia sp. NPDC088792]|uniref:hypothetical protein n=1 Tax=Nocardia sp. NPDC088792 TaxID=3364332 RepID=UPI003810E74D